MELIHQYFPQIQKTHCNIRSVAKLQYNLEVGYKLVTGSRLQVQKWWHNLLYADAISLLATMKYQDIQKIDKIVNTGEENPHIFRKTWGISTKFF